MEQLRLAVVMSAAVEVDVCVRSATREAWLGTADFGDSRDLKRLSPTMKTWVPHILLFIVPRQMVLLGDPAKRACDATESFGALVKKVIKHHLK